MKCPVKIKEGRKGARNFKKKQQGQQAEDNNKYGRSIITLMSVV
jgi:hypothetical protein